MTQRRPASQRLLPLLGLALVGLAACVVGVALVLSTSPSAGFGWTAYSPLSAEQYVPFPVGGGDWQTPVGLILAVAGSALLGVTATLLILGRAARLGEPASRSAD